MSFKSESIQRYWIISVLLLFGFSYVIQLRYDSWRRFEANKIKTTYNIFIEPQPLAPSTAKLVSFGNQEFLASWYWLNLIQYYGGGEPYGQYRKLAELFNTVTELSPRFLNAYQTGLLVLPGEGFKDEAINLGLKGQKNLPQSWELPYYTGLDYHIYKKDYVAAAKEFEKAAQIPGAPENTRYFSALYYSNADQRLIAYQIFKNVYETTTNDYFKDRAKKQLDHLQIVFGLEDAVKAFQQKYQRNPQDLNELVEKKIISQVPVSPLGYPLSIDQKSGAIKDTKS